MHGLQDDGRHSIRHRRREYRQPGFFVRSLSRLERQRRGLELARYGLDEYLQIKHCLLELQA